MAFGLFFNNFMLYITLPVYFLFLAETQPQSVQLKKSLKCVNFYGL
jgi:hypothetical protein